jgi:hypothetical protein
MSFSKLLVITSFFLIVPVLSMGQPPVKCTHKSKEHAPRYLIGWSTYSVEGPRTLFLAVSIDARHFSRDEMVALARRIRQDFCHEQRLDVALLENYKAARAFVPTKEIEWSQKHWRGDYFLDRESGEESISFSTAPGKPRSEVKVNLGVPIQNQKH